LDRLAPPDRKEYRGRRVTLERRVQQVRKVPRARKDLPDLKD